MESDPLGQVDFGGSFFSEMTDELMETWYIDGTRQDLLQRKGVRR